MTQLTNLRLSGWKSIRDAAIELRALNILVGANGAGKSNLVSFFEVMNEMMSGRLQVQIGKMGGAESILHYGSKVTRAVEAEFRFVSGSDRSDYSLRLTSAVANKLIFEEEAMAFTGKAQMDLADGTSVRHGQPESNLKVLSGLDTPNTNLFRAGKMICSYLTSGQVFHFHDTSLLGPMRRDCPVDSNRCLSSDGANLPAMVYLYQERYPIVYRRIVAAVKAVTPSFEDFILEPLRLNPRNIALHWRAKGADYEFGPHQLSDGTLRAIALFTLVLQPEDDLPELIVLDEPELGLHPAALAVLADLLKSAAEHTQLLIATQSTALIDHFEVEDIVTVNLRDGCSTFERLDPERLKEWLEEYKVSELWERNVIGGGPY